nr:reverse transcriptase domain-containing protein [Tanacetum cinerariifolium]
MIESSNGDTPFLLTYKMEAVIPAEIGMPTLRTVEVDLVGNNKALEINLDLLEERREEAAIPEAKSKAKIEKYYNSKVRNTSFKPGDLVYRNNDASRVEDTGKLGPKVLVNKSQNKTPYELFNVRSSAIGFLKPFGYHVMILYTLDNLGKFEAKGDEGYFIGYSMSSKAFRDAKTLFEAIQARFCGNDATKKTQRTLLKQMYKNFNAPNTENKPDLDIMSFDDLYNNFKIVEQEIKGTTSSSSSSQNMAFVSSPSSTNEVNTAYGVSTANTQVSPASTQVSPASTQVSTASTQ